MVSGMTILCVRVEPWVGRGRWLVPRGQVTCRRSASGSHAAGENIGSMPSQKFCVKEGFFSESLGRLSQCLWARGQGRGMSEIMCREGLAHREYPHTHTCECTGAHMCIIVAARGDGSTVASKDCNYARAFCSFLVRWHCCLNDWIHANLTPSFLLLGLLPSPAAFSPPVSPLLLSGALGPTPVYLLIKWLWGQSKCQWMCGHDLVSFS